MALPKINETLKFTLDIPSTGQRVKYRPYLVKEEKILLQAFESQNIQTILETMCDTITCCLDEREEIDVGKLATFDVEYMFLQIRSASVGESANVSVKCPDCEDQTTVSVDVAGISIDVPDQDNVVQITDEISVEMKYPSYEDVASGDLQDLDAQDADKLLNVVASAISAVLTQEERFDTSTEKKEEVVAFLDSLTSAQFRKISEFLEGLPVLKQDVAFTCESCKTEKNVELRGLADFF